MSEPTKASENLPRLGNVASRGRLAFAVLAPPAMWSAQGLLGWFFASHACAQGGPSWGALSAGGVRTLLFLMSLAALVVSLAALFTGYRGWKRLAGAAEPGDRLRESAEFLAIVGVMAGTALSIGIFWATLPSLLVRVCGVVR
jgi:hypothetical protein